MLNRKNSPLVKNGEQNLDANTTRSRKKNVEALDNLDIKKQLAECWQKMAALCGAQNWWLPFHLMQLSQLSFKLNIYIYIYSKY